MYVNNLGVFELLMCASAVAVAVFLLFNSTRGNDKARRKTFLGAGLIMVSFMFFALDLASRGNGGNEQQGIYVAPVPSWLYYSIMVVGIIYMLVGYVNKLTPGSRTTNSTATKAPRTRAKKGTTAQQASDASILPGVGGSD